MCPKASCCNLLPRLDEPDGRHRLQVVPEMVTHCRLKHLVDQVAHRSNHADDSRSPGVGHVDLHLEVDFENKALLTLRDNLLELGVQIVRLGNRVGPVQGEDGRRHDFGFIAAWVQSGTFLYAVALATLRDGPAGRAIRT